MQRSFIIRPFGTKKDRAGKEVDFERVHGNLIDPALRAVGLGGGTTGEIAEASLGTKGFVLPGCTAGVKLKARPPSLAKNSR
jgi:hypothetical protein